MGGRSKPRPFSQDFWGAIYSKDYLEIVNSPSGAIGTVELIWHSHAALYYISSIEKFYKRAK
jgi:hypothetical protein